jgi:CRP-like cAMP-binding protein/SAM-dependent methyltransferase
MRDLGIFKGLNEPSIEWLLANARPETHLADALAVSEGDSPQSLYIVSSGLYAATVSSGSLRHQVGHLSPGAVFGEMAWLCGTAATATVKAVESSEALVLPFLVLEKKLEQDPTFAGEFMRALARSLAHRQRASNATLLSVAQGDKFLADAQPEIGELTRSLAGFREIVAQCDREERTKRQLSVASEKALRDRFNALLATLETTTRHLFATSPSAADALGAKVQAEMLPYLLATDTMQRMYAKPRGYAGDFETIEHIYDQRAGGVGVGIFIDRIFLDQAAPRAVRNRRKLLADRIVETVNRTSGPASVMSLACGPAREVSDAFAALPRNKWPAVTLLDIDVDALQLALGRLTGEGCAQNVDVVNANLIRLALGREKLFLPGQDLIYSIGLIDYFSDEFVVRLLNWIHAGLAPGGEVILGNFHPRNPLKAAMDYVLDWKLIHRSEADMDRLFAASAFGGCKEIVFEETGINLFATGVRS